MKRLFIALFIISFLSCDDPQYNDLLPDRIVNVTINLSNPEYINLQVNGGNAETPTSEQYGFKGIFLIRRSQDRYAAFERACPHLTLSECSRMTFDGFYFKCPCDNSTFSSFDGSSNDTPYTAREYHVQVVNASTLKITNF